MRVEASRISLTKSFRELMKEFYAGITAAYIYNRFRNLIGFKQNDQKENKGKLRSI